MILKKTGRRVLSLVLAVLTLAGALAMPAMELPVNAISQADIDRKIAEKNALKSKIKSQQGVINDLKQNQGDYVARKQALDDQQTLAMEQILLVQEELAMYREMIAQKQEEARIAQEAADAQLEIYKKHIRNLEEQGVNNMYLDLLFSSKSFSELITRIDMVGEIMAYDKRIEDEYKAAKAEADAARAEYEQAEAELAEQEGNLQAEIEALTKQMQEIQAEIDELQSNINEYASVIREYEAQEKALNAEISKMQEELKKQENPPTATGAYTWPCPSCWLITSGFGNRPHPLGGGVKFHAGVDIGAQQGAPIVAADGGNVQTSTNGGGYGNYVIIYHGNGRSTLYGHMSSRAVKAGDTVQKGQVIGYVGSTGNVTGPHLHFEVRIDGAPVNPLQYFSGYTILG